MDKELKELIEKSGEMKKDICKTFGINRSYLYMLTHGYRKSERMRTKIKHYLLTLIELKQKIAA